MITLDSTPQGYDDYCARTEAIWGNYPNTEEGTEEALKSLLDSKYESNIDDLELRAFINGHLLGELIKRKVPNAKWLKDFSGLKFSDTKNNTLKFFPQNKLYKYYTGEDTSDDVIGFYISTIESCKGNNLDKFAKALKKAN